LAFEVETDIEMFSKFFELQKLTEVVIVSHDISAVSNDETTFLLTDFNGRRILVDIIPTTNNIKLEMLKGDSIRKLLEIKRGGLVAVEDSIAGNAVPSGP
jgi:hypothetical protein